MHKKERGVEETTPLFSHAMKVFLGVLSIVLVLFSLVISERPVPSLLGQIPLARDVMPQSRPVGNTFVIKNIRFGDAIGKDVPVLTERHLGLLRAEPVETNAGKTDVRQFLVLHNSEPGGFSGGEMVFGRDNEGKLGQFVRFRQDKPLFEYVIAFSPGLASSVQDGRLTDLVQAELLLFGKPFYIVDAEKQEQRVRLRLMGSFGMFEFEDSNVGDALFEQGVRGKSGMLDADVRITGFKSQNVFFITEIRYRPRSVGHEKKDVFVPPRNGLRTRLRQPATLLSSSVDIIYGGVKGQVLTGDTVNFEGKGDDYFLSFVNTYGQSYKIPFVTTDPSFKYGDASHDLVFVEGASSADFNIDQNDLFIVTNKLDINGVTNVLRYSRALYADSKIVVDDLSGSSKTVSFDAGTGEGTLIVSGNTYRFFVSAAGDHPIVVDQNGDGVIDGGEARIILRAGNRLDIGSSNAIAGTQIALSITTPSRLFAEPKSDETINFVINKESEGPDVAFPSPGALTVIRDKDKIDRGLSVFGVSMVRDSAHVPSQVIFQFGGIGDLQLSSEGTAVITAERERFVRRKP